MTSKRRIRRRSCRSKKRFANQTEAVAAKISLEKDGFFGRHTYQCKLCGGWHIGRYPDYVKREIEKR
jgi:hypothetical protein